MSKARDLSATRNLSIRTSNLISGVLNGYSEETRFITSNAGVLTLSFHCNSYHVTVTENITSIIFTDYQGSNMQPITVMFEQSTTNFTVPYFNTAGYFWPNGVATNLTQLPNAIDVYSFFTYDGIITYAQYIGLFRATNHPPVANAGPDATYYTDLPGNFIHISLDGSGSYDPDLQPILYNWQQVGGPTQTLSDSAAIQPAFDAPDVITSTDVTWELVVTDSMSTSSLPDQVVITLLPPCANNTLSPTMFEATQHVTLQAFNGYICKTTDLVHWTPIYGDGTLPGNNMGTKVYAFGSNVIYKFPVMPGDQEDLFLLSTDNGNTWQRVSLATDLVLSNSFYQINGIITNGTTYVAYGYYQTFTPSQTLTYIITSTDLINWTKITSNGIGTSVTSLDVGCYGNKFVVAGFDAIFSSSDAANWTTTPLPNHARSRSFLAWNGSVFITQSDSTTYTMSLMTSSDAITWDVFSPVGFDTNVYYPDTIVSFGNGPFVATSNGLIYESLDWGANWTVYPAPTNPNWFGSIEDLTAISSNTLVAHNGNYDYMYNTPGPPTPYQDWYDIVATDYSAPAPSTTYRYVLLAVAASGSHLYSIGQCNMGFA